MWFMEKTHGPSTEEYIKWMKSSWLVCWRSFLSLILIEDVVIWWKLCNYNKIQIFLDKWSHVEKKDKKH
jgi:hypothetical protein